MPPMFEIRLKGALVTCVGFLASSLGVFAVRCLQISFLRSTLTPEWSVERTFCYRLTSILPILNTKTHLYRRWEDKPHTKAATSISENPPSPSAPAIVRPTFV